MNWDCYFECLEQFNQTMTINSKDSIMKYKMAKRGGYLLHGRSYTYSKGILLSPFTTTF
jgi:hypothetical protein